MEKCVNNWTGINWVDTGVTQAFFGSVAETKVICSDKTSVYFEVSSKSQTVKSSTLNQVTIVTIVFVVEASAKCSQTSNVVTKQPKFDFAGS